MESTDGSESLEYSDMDRLMRVWSAVEQLENEVFIRSRYDDSGRTILVETKIPSDTIDDLADSFNNERDMHNADALVAECERIRNKLLNMSLWETKRSVLIIRAIGNILSNCIRTLFQMPSQYSHQDQARLFAIQAKLSANVATILKMTKHHNNMKSTEAENADQPIKTS